MEYITPLTCDHLDEMGVMDITFRQAYFSPGSVAYCLLVNDSPVLAGGIVNMTWHRGEAWMLATDWFRNHVKSCYRHVMDLVPRMAYEGRFHRVQATCPVITSDSGKWFSCSNSVRLFQHLGFKYEGTMAGFGKNGETCYLYARIF